MVTKEQVNIIKKMGTVHQVRIYGEGGKGALIVFSHNEEKKQYLSYRIGIRGTADLLSTIKESALNNQEWDKMLSVDQYGVVDSNP